MSEAETAISQKFADIKLNMESNGPRFRHRWVLWHLSADKDKFWDDRLEEIECVDNMVDLMALHSRVPRPDQLPSRSDYYFFKERIQPSWDDPNNIYGGRWIVTLKKSRVKDDQVREERTQKLNDFWLRLMVALAEERFGYYGEQICGAVLIAKRSKDVIALWTRDASVVPAIRSIGDAFKEVLNTPENDPIYEKHPNFDSNKSLSPVLMIYGLAIEHFNCDKVFNLLCPYGDCLKVKFLKPGSNTCMVQMRSPADTFYIIKHLTGLWLYGNVIQFSSSHQEFVHLYGPRMPFAMPDGAPAFKDFSKSRNLRFRTQELANKNRRFSPTKQLYFFGAPYNVTEDHIYDIFEKHSLSPRNVLFFNNNNNGKQNNSMGIIFFYSADEAIEGLIACNHAPFMGLPPAKHPHVLKLSFAPGQDNDDEEQYICTEATP